MKRVVPLVIALVLFRCVPMSEGLVVDDVDDLQESPEDCLKRELSNKLSRMGSNGRCYMAEDQADDDESYSTYHGEDFHAIPGSVVMNICYEAPTCFRQEIWSRMVDKCYGMGYNVGACSNVADDE